MALSTLDNDLVPRVGETWKCDVTGRVTSSQDGLASARVIMDVRITWASKCGRVFEGAVIRKGKLDDKVPLYRGLIRERVSAS